MALYCHQFFMKSLNSNRTEVLMLATESHEQTKLQWSLRPKCNFFNILFFIFFNTLSHFSVNRTQKNSII